MSKVARTWFTGNFDIRVGGREKRPWDERAGERERSRRVIGIGNRIRIGVGNAIRIKFRAEIFIETTISIVVLSLSIYARSREEKLVEMRSWEDATRWATKTLRNMNATLGVFRYSKLYMSPKIFSQNTSRFV
ncbi:hypothetical protein EVAR_29090_1 [Eumeta japonica]|uniref:Uncharacterized protein n=1 Tax=Eumeta variegata TaxID=151549 RepID=A0A4C1VMV5_EUMVA|nr:hypothetical protein EVAR_29090_1 [Eumeta japonica]